jgi:hypothetical protein
LICCALVAVLVGVAAKGGGRATLSAIRVVVFGLSLGYLTFEALAAALGGVGLLRTDRPELVAVSGVAVTVLGVSGALTGGVPLGARAWALTLLSASGGSALAELGDLHLLRIHTHAGLLASIGLHGLAVAFGLTGARMLVVAASHVHDRPQGIRPSLLGMFTTARPGVKKP